MLGLFDRLVLTATQRSIATRPARPQSHSELIGDSFILDWSLDGTEAADAVDDDNTIELTASAK